MIVCLCRRVSDRDIHRAVQHGVADFEVLQDQTGVASHCGCCHDCAREVFDEARSACAGRASGVHTVMIMPAAATA
ncbi:(2Fe-2S)-binding protein [Aquabacterium sp.]|uniref:(2Fe-2S)-binding protein n=1 Tax=Aquabacterium sp. TaxID=1872578 RepID=UPI002C25D6CE|nr:(2Fe-2S)-binding protein [Aquabacterium sp.]HSW04896.1 (2Fe-2S)-binding protein [Aquabacterium sp.]